METVKIYDEDNLIKIEDEFDITRIYFYPENKKFKVSRSVKNDCLESNQTYEYKLSVNPIEIKIRLLESMTEHPEEYSVKNGVVLESEILKNEGETEPTLSVLVKERINDLKKSVEWGKSNLRYDINFFILSKHPEIISKEEYKKFLRQMEEKITQ